MIGRLVRSNTNFTIVVAAREKGKVGDDRFECRIGPDLSYLLLESLETLPRHFPLLPGD